MHPPSPASAPRCPRPARGPTDAPHEATPRTARVSAASLTDASRTENSRHSCPPAASSASLTQPDDVRARITELPAARGAGTRTGGATTTVVDGGWLNNHTAAGTATAMRTAPATLAQDIDRLLLQPSSDADGSCGVDTHDHRLTWPWPHRYAAQPDVLRRLWTLPLRPLCPCHLRRPALRVCRPLGGREGMAPLFFSAQLTHTAAVSLLAPARAPR